MKTPVASLCLLVAVILATASSSAAHEFVLSKAGTLKLNGVGVVQVKFNAGTIECDPGEPSPMTIKSLASIVTLLKPLPVCKGLGTSASFTAGEVLLDAEGTSGIGDIGLDLLSASIPAGHCSVNIINGNGNSTLKGITYASGTNNETLKMNVAITGMEYEPVGTTNTCGTSKVIAKNGEYKGEFTLQLEGGKIEWK